MEHRAIGHWPNMRPLRIALLLSVAACGGPAIATDDVAFLDSGVDSTVSDAASDATTDAGADAADDATAFTGGGPFLCFGCVCDGTIDMCVAISGGAQNAPLADAGLGDASACNDEVGQSSCQQIPADCLPKPTCACLLAHYPAPACSCAVDPSGNGLAVTCVYP
jgi:hypothetical protein